MNPKRIVPMWLVDNALFHYSDKERADLKGTAQEVWVGVDRDYFVGTWQFADRFEGWIFHSEKEAIASVSAYNRETIR